MSDCGIDSTTVASTLAYTLKELKREGLTVDKMENNEFLETFTLVSAGKITKDSITPVIRKVAEDSITPEEAARKLNLIMLSKEDVKMIIQRIVASQEQMVKERGPAAMGPLMGMAMKELKGKADGKLVNKLLKEEINRNWGR
jgi:glutamyl-tRNA(Gln) amidotransferase subunit E